MSTKTGKYIVKYTKKWTVTFSNKIYRIFSPIFQLKHKKPDTQLGVSGS